MNELRFYVESAKFAAIKKILIIVGVLPGAFLGFTGLLKAMGERGGFESKCYRLALPVGILFAILWVAGIIVYFRNRCQFTITPMHQGNLQITVRDASGNTFGDAGRWTWRALYTKHYYKLGTYRKQIYLILFCNDKMFCMLRHEIAPAFPPPEGFAQLDHVPEVNAPVYFTNQTLAVFGMVRAVNVSPQY